MESRGRVLIIEDEAEIVSFLTLELEHEGYEVASATDGRRGLEMALEQTWSVILLDVMLPHLSGMEVCRRLRTERDVPIVMLTARHSVPERVAGLDAGANDYVAKPFAIEELLARIRVLLRPAQNAEHVLRAGDLELDVSGRQARRAGVPIELTAREFDLLHYLMRHKNQVFTRELLIEKVWGYDFTGETNIVDVYVRYVRNKVDRPFDQPLIVTVRGVGYMLKAPS